MQKSFTVEVLLPNGKTEIKRIAIGEKGELPEGITRLTVNGNRVIYLIEGLYSPKCLQLEEEEI